MATTPYEIIAGPAELWVAVVGTAFPDVDDPPAAAWYALGDTEGGVTARHMQTVELLRTDQKTGPRKAIRSEEGLEIETALAELDLENYSRVLKATLTGSIIIVPAGANNDLLFTQLTEDVVTIEFVNDGVDQALTVTKSGTGTAADPFDIVVHLETDPAGDILSDAADVLAAVNADADSNTLVEASHYSGSTGAGLVTVMPATGVSRKSITLRQGLDSERWAILARGPSPYMDADMQYEVPIVTQTEEPEVQFVRDDKAVLACKWVALENDAAATPEERFGNLRAQAS